ncbi:MAG: hypothetical protein JXX28_17465 [Deltaproteobacteria bacterium]|nr:hypothetical protein [Deltaproteobacteria bacterium]
MDRREGRALRLGEAVQSLVEAGELPVAPLHTGAGSLEQHGAGLHFGVELLGGLGVEVLRRVIG